MILGVITVLVSQGMEPEYVLELNISAAIHLSRCYQRANAMRRAEFVLDTQMAVGSLLSKDVKISEYVEQLLKPD